MHLSEFFSKIGEHFAAGFFKDINASYMARHAHALAETLNQAELPPYQGTKLYPQGGVSIWNLWHKAVYGFNYYHTVRAYVPNPYATLIEKAKQANINVTPALDAQIRVATRDHAFNVAFLRGWTHSVINYERILKEGLKTYIGRVTAKMPRQPGFYQPLLEVLLAIQNYIRRSETMLRQHNADKLADVFAKMVSEPADTLYEAFVYYNFFWFIDDPDSAGRMDAILETYPKDLSDDEIQELFRECWLSYDKLGVWHVTFDSHLKWLQPALKAQRGLSRPGSSILIDETTPQETWDAIFDSWESGNPSPGLYFRPNYYKYLDKMWNVKPDDFCGLSYGGCTELMIMGKSNVGSTDGKLNALQVLTETPFDAPTFDDFYQTFLNNIREMSKQEVDRCQLGHQVAAMYQPNLIRTLFTEDCIDNHTEFNAGGARYNSGLIGVIGLSNTVNALYNIKQAYEGKLCLKQLKDALDNDFQGYETLRKQLLDAPKFGNDDDAIDPLATKVINDIFDSVFAESRPDRTYIPFINLFTTYAAEGSFVNASADGRAAGAPVGDSFGPVQGTDDRGPTAMLNSVTKPDQSKALGTPVLNMRLHKDMVATPEKRELTKAMLMTYFQRGGLQIQVSILDAEAMKKALDNPDDYKSLIVRIGGYSEYFTRLSKAVQLEVIKRSEHAL